MEATAGLSAKSLTFRRVGYSLCCFVISLFSVFSIPTYTLASPPPISSEVTVSATIPFPTGNLRLTGYASPNALVTFLRQGIVTGTGSANSASFFDKTITGLDPGVQTFSIFASDSQGRTTLTLSFDVNIISGTTVTLSGFLLPPTISVGKTTLKRPDVQTADGAARQAATITAFFNSDPISKQVQTENDGSWQARVTETFHLGSHSSNALVQDTDGNQSILSQTRAFTVVLSADLNVDNLVNLIDFSILMFNYARQDFPNKAADINDNGAPPDLTDFSVMMFYWTGG